MLGVALSLLRLEVGARGVVVFRLALLGAVLVEFVELSLWILAFPAVGCLLPPALKGDGNLQKKSQ